MVVVDWEMVSAFVIFHKGMYPPGGDESIENLQ